MVPLPCFDTHTFPYFDAHTGTHTKKGERQKNLETRARAARQRQEETKEDAKWTPAGVSFCRLYLFTSSFQTPCRGVASDSRRRQRRRLPKKRKKITKEKENQQRKRTKKETKNEAGKRTKWASCGTSGLGVDDAGERDLVSTLGPTLMLDAPPFKSHSKEMVRRARFPVWLSLLSVAAVHCFGLAACERALCVTVRLFRVRDADASARSANRDVVVKKKSGMRGRLLTLCTPLRSPSESLCTKQR